MTFALLIVAGLLAAPYCGLLFGCGCSWPWEGLADHCNFFDPASPLRCPWCEYPLTAILSLAAGVVAGLWCGRRRTVLVRALGATMAFFLSTGFAAWLTAIVTGYPWPA